MRKLDKFFHEVLERQRKKKDLASDDTLQKFYRKISNLMGPLSKMWYRIWEANCRGPNEFDLEAIKIKKRVQESLSRTTAKVFTQSKQREKLKN